MQHPPLSNALCSRTESNRGSHCKNVPRRVGKSPLLHRTSVTVLTVTGYCGGVAMIRISVQNCAPLPFGDCGFDTTPDVIEPRQQPHSKPLPALYINAPCPVSRL